MTPEEVLNQLIEDGKISQVDVEKINCGPNNPAFRHLVEGLHAIMCNLNHDIGECNFHYETINENTWKNESHQKWSKYAKSLIINSGYSPDQLLGELRIVADILENVQELSITGRTMLHDLIEATPAESVDRTLSRMLQNQHEET